MIPIACPELTQALQLWAFRYSTEEYSPRQQCHGLRSRGVVSVDYTAEYLFGYDLRPGSYDVVDTPGGIEVRLRRPALVGTPAVTNLRHEVLSGGILTDEGAAVTELYEEASERARKRGAEMAEDEAIVALCERSLGAFLRDFLSKQPGVTRVPAIAVRYRESPAQSGVTLPGYDRIEEQGVINSRYFNRKQEGLRSVDWILDCATGEEVDRGPVLY